MRLYKLSLADQYRMLREQNDECLSCGQYLEIDVMRNVFQNKNAAVVDHDRVSGSVRGLLHTDCNLTVGDVEKSFERVVAAMRYVERWRAAISSKTVWPQWRATDIGPRFNVSLETIAA